MPLKLRTVPNLYTPQLSDEPLSLSQLQVYADDIQSEVERTRPEYGPLCRLQRAAGNRINEMFESDRWTFPTTTAVQIRPQKGNAVRIVSLFDLGFQSVEAMRPVLADMDRLPKGQYERAFASAVKVAGLWRLYEGGFLHPSTHFFRHLKIKLLKAQNFSPEYIATWIGEKKVQNLDYYFNSQYFAEIR